MVCARLQRGGHQLAEFRETTVNERGSQNWSASTFNGGKTLQVNEYNQARVTYVVVVVVRSL